jgi:hypothetical protein
MFLGFNRPARLLSLDISGISNVSAREVLTVEWRYDAGRKIFSYLPGVTGKVWASGLVACQLGV